MILTLTGEKELNVVISLSVLSLRSAAKENWPYSVSLGTLCKESKGNQLMLASKIKGYVLALGMALAVMEHRQRKRSNTIV